MLIGSLLNQPVFPVLFGDNRVAVLFDTQGSVVIGAVRINNATFVELLDVLYGKPTFQMTGKEAELLVEQLSVRIRHDFFTYVEVLIYFSNEKAALIDSRKIQQQAAEWICCFYLFDKFRTIAVCGDNDSWQQIYNRINGLLTNLYSGSMVAEAGDLHFLRTVKPIFRTKEVQRLTG